MKSVLVHPLSGLLSAYGMGLADIRATRTQALEESLSTTNGAAVNSGKKLGGEVKRELAGQGVAASRSG
jgi:5-oxoprolinase (ATP-hydrolysing)